MLAFQWKTRNPVVWMRDLPSGTVTFLFTDVEGSTKLLHKLGAEEYAQTLGEHRRILRADHEPTPSGIRSVSP